MTAPLVAFYGDDFTGSIDALLQYRRAGLEGILLTGVEHLTATVAAGHQVVGIAGTSRALPTAAMTAELAPAFTAVRDLGPHVVQYKACSTADSSPDVGSLGRAIEVGRSVFGDLPVPVLLAQPDFGRFTVFGTHFAADGDQVYRLDRQPTMAHHPVTPMDEADLVVFLARQTRLEVANLPFTAYPTQVTLARPANGPGDRPPPGVIVLDALSEEHLLWAGRAILAERHQPVFAVGSGGLSRGVGLALSLDGGGETLATEAAPADGPVLVVSGSRSARSWAQVQRAVADGWTAIDALAERAPWELAATALAQGRSVVAYSSAPNGCSQPDGAVVAERLARIVATVNARSALTRLVVAGGDTSGRVLRQLAVEQIEILAAPWANAALCRSVGGPLNGCQLVLKGGQMGPPDLFELIRTGVSLRHPDTSTQEERN